MHCTNSFFASNLLNLENELKVKPDVLSSLVAYDWFVQFQMFFYLFFKET